MLLTLDRQPSWRDTTLGLLWVGGAFQCYALEDQVRHGAKIPGVTAIPAGRYRVDITWSPRFGRRLPVLLDVPGFDGVRIHPGNTAADTEGCILVGRLVVDATRIAESAAAFADLFALLEAGVANDEGCWIDIVDPLAA